MSETQTPQAPTPAPVESTPPPATTVADGQISITSPPTGELVKEQPKAPDLINDPKPEVKTSPEKPSDPIKVEVPEKYDLKLSENSLLDKSAVEKIEAYAKSQGLSQADAQSVLRAQEEDVSAFIETQKTKWAADSLADKEIGGEKMNENIELAKRTLDRFGTPALKAELTKTGYGNHPEMVRLLVKIGQASAPDKFIAANATDKPTRSRASLMYDHPSSKN